MDVEGTQFHDNNKPNDLRLHSYITISATYHNAPIQTF